MWVAPKRAFFTKLVNLSSLLWEKDGLDIWENTSLSNGDATEEFVKFFVVLDGELKVTWDDTSLLVVTSSVASEFKDLGGHVLEDSGGVDGCTGSNTVGIVASLQKAVDTANWELKTSAG